MLFLTTNGVWNHVELHSVHTHRRLVPDSGLEATCTSSAFYVQVDYFRTNTANPE